MSYPGKSRSTIIVTNSPVSFAIMGAGEWHRRVLIRSNDCNLDLVGLDDRTFQSDLKILGEGLSSSPLAGLLIPEPRSFIVRTRIENAQPVSNADNRNSHLSFAWRGLASERDLRQIESTFSMMAADLVTALNEDTDESAEWQVAPLVALCHRKTNSYLALGKRTRAAWVFTLVVYGLVALAFALNLPFLFERFKL